MSNFDLFFSNFSIFSILIVSIIGITILFLGVFLLHTGEFTRFIHSLIVSFLLYFLWLENFSIIARDQKASSLTVLEFWQGDSFFYYIFLFYSTFILRIFFIGVAERFIFSKRNIREFALIIFFIYIAGLFLFYLHTLRDFLLVLEIITLASYVLATFERQNRFSTYAGIQYFLLGSLPSARLLLGFSLFYLQGGSVAIEDLDLIFNNFFEINFQVFENQNIFIKDYFQNSNLSIYNVTDSVIKEFNIQSNSFNFHENFIILNPITTLTLRGFFLILFNLFFKLTAAPFHIWAPSVYGNAPIASVTFLSIYSKALVLFFFFKLRVSFLHAFSFIILYVLIFIGLLSIIIGILGAFIEKRIKRFFVYSSRGHVGFRLIGLSLFTLQGAAASFHYLAIYIVSSFLRWFYPRIRGREKHHLTHFISLKKTNPILAFIFSFLVFSRSGIPPLGGFFIKLDILSILLDSSHFFINYILFFFTVASFFYYLRLIKIRFFDKQISSGVNVLFRNKFSIDERPRFAGRIWLRVVLFLFLSFYIFIIQKPLLLIQQEAFSYIFLLYKSL